MREGEGMTMQTIDITNKDMQHEAEIEALQDQLLQAATREEQLALQSRLFAAIRARSPGVVAVLEHRLGIAA